MKGRRGYAAATTDGDPWRRVRLGLIAVAGVLVVGTVGYVLLGLSPLDALYQTVTTVSTVGFRELGESDDDFQLFTIVLILAGVGTVLYTLTVLLETLIEGRLTDQLRRRRVARDIASMRGHVVICGYGRLGRTIATHLAQSGRDLVVIDRDEGRVSSSSHLSVVGDATDDAILEAAGLDRASTLIAALDTDTDNLYLTLSARSTRPDLYIIARAKLESAEPKLRQAGADRVVNPQLIGGSRIAAMTLQPNVLEFVDVVLHDGSLEFRLEELSVQAGSELAGHTLASARLREQTGAMVLALRGAGGDFVPNPDPGTMVEAGHVLIAIGTDDQLLALSRMAVDRSPGRSSPTPSPGAPGESRTSTSTSTTGRGSNR
jgi:voltage-gated potassium channel